MEVDIVTMILNIPSNDLLCQFLHNSVDEQIGKICTNVGQINNDIDWSEENQALARKYIQNIFQNAALNDNFKMAEVLKDLREEKIKCIEECYNIRKGDIMKHLQLELLAKSNKPVTVDYDWKVKWVLGSSSLSSIREPIVQMDLHTLKINENNENLTNTIRFEMNLNEFKDFRKKLELALPRLKKN